MDITVTAKKNYLVPGVFQVQVDYVSGLNPIYVGYADPGLATSLAGWYIQKIVWNSDGNPTSITVANNAIWDNRATTTYA